MVPECSPAALGRLQLPPVFIEEVYTDGRPPSPNWRERRAKAWTAPPLKVWPERAPPRPELRHLPPRPVTAPPGAGAGAPLRGLLERQQRDLAAGNISFAEWQHARRRTGSRVSADVRALAIAGVRTEVAKRSRRELGQRAGVEHVRVNVPSSSFAVVDSEATERGGWHRTRYNFEFSAQVQCPGRPLVRCHGSGTVDDTDNYPAVFLDSLQHTREWLPPPPPWDLPQGAALEP
eukprot:TRINITY_DN55227_c0_g1_i1.p1 TRINITY_DN55227_c0_g1~~TRINITY_DN55227_c0_g1_i1.p1  ORF type:complete len:256 (+),score=78.91 TRINITY_DN55227_c0_g1_i1:68-769(+)